MNDEDFDKEVGDFLDELEMDFVLAEKTLSEIDDTERKVNFLLENNPEKNLEDIEYEVESLITSISKRYGSD